MPMTHAGSALYSIDVEEKGAAVRYRLHEHGCRPANQCRHAQQIAGSNVADRDLAAVSGVHVHAQQPWTITASLSASASVYTVPPDDKLTTCPPVISDSMIAFKGGLWGV